METHFTILAVLKQATKAFLWNVVEDLQWTPASFIQPIIPSIIHIIKIANGCCKLIKITWWTSLSKTLISKIAETVPTIT